MASNLGACPRAMPRAAYVHTMKTPLISPRARFIPNSKSKPRIQRGWRIKVLSSDENPNSYLDMWRSAVDRDRKTAEFQKIADKTEEEAAQILSGGERADLEKKTEDFNKILEVSSEERDRIQRMQVIDRAAAAIAAARAVINERKPGDDKESSGGDDGDLKISRGGDGTQKGSVFVAKSENSGNEVPGPDFWSWTPPDSDRDLNNVSDFQTAMKSSVYPRFTNPMAVKERSTGFLSIPFESKLSEAKQSPPIPPLQSFMEVEKEVSESVPEIPSVREEEHEIDAFLLASAVEAAHVLEEKNLDALPSHGVNADGLRWWKETGVEQRPDGVICRWTMVRGVSADLSVEWQEKFWEASDELGYKELGSEKSGRNATGNVWREFWRESMFQESGLVHIEKTADKWGKNGKGDQWQEQWWEHHDASGRAEKWAHKWCSIDPTTHVEVGHAHVWHERWGEKFDGHGGSTKYTDKWAERCEGDAWTKWGDKWDENFNPNGHGVKQGETWWEGKHGERWNRTWGERHNSSGWIHKYGKSSSGEHWDTHVEQDTWYERFPHYGFYHCFDNSVQLREVRKPSEIQELWEVRKPSEIQEV